MRNYLDKTIDFLKDVEGFDNFPYVDTTGNLTIGYGRNLTDKGISMLEADFLLHNDVVDVLDFLRDFFDDFESYPDNVKVVLISMVFNLGESGFLSFKRFIEAIKNWDFKTASFELLNSKRALQVPNRVKKEKFLLDKVIDV